MTTTRRPLKPGKKAVTKAAVETYRRMLALRLPGDNRVQSEEYFEAARELDRLMQRQPWQTSILDALAGDGDPGATDWHEVSAIAVQLKEAAAK